MTISNPYVGPRTFSHNEADRFFGREREARDLFSLAAIPGAWLYRGAMAGERRQSRYFPGVKYRIWLSHRAGKEPFFG